MEVEASTSLLSLHLRLPHGCTKTAKGVTQSPKNENRKQSQGLILFSFALVLNLVVRSDQKKGGGLEVPVRLAGLLIV